jgi:polyhydroxybutyrate depolymerase
MALAIFALAATSTCYASTQESLTVGGVSRTYFVYLPKSYSSSQKVPVVFVLHPFSKDAAWAEHTMGWDRCADKNGFIVVYGQSSSDRGVWNAGLTRSERASGADDVGYLEAVVDAVETSYSVDMSHVYMVGFSAGAIMTAKLGSTIPKSLTAIATVEGTTGFADQDMFVPSSPLSAIMFRGTADDVVPYTSDVTSSLFHAQMYSATGSASDWAQADGCASTPTTSQVNGGHILLTDYKGGAGGGEVQLMTVNGGKHEYRPEDTDLIWQFFSAQTKATVQP